MQRFELDRGESREIELLRKYLPEFNVKTFNFSITVRYK